MHRLDAKTWSIRRNRGQQWLSISSQAQAKSDRNWCQSKLFLARPIGRLNVEELWPALSTPAIPIGGAADGIAGPMTLQSRVSKAVGVATLPDISFSNICAARSPTTTQGAIVFPVGIRGNTDPSAIIRLSMP